MYILLIFETAYDICESFNDFGQHYGKYPRDCSKLVPAVSTTSGRLLG